MNDGQLRDAAALVQAIFRDAVLTGHDLETILSRHGFHYSSENKVSRRFQHTSNLIFSVDDFDVRYGINLAWEPIPDSSGDLDAIDLYRKYPNIYAKCLDTFVQVLGTPSYEVSEKLPISNHVHMYVPTAIWEDEGGRIRLDGFYAKSVEQVAVSVFLEFAQENK